MLADWEVSFLVYDYLTRTACSETVKAFYAECSFLKSVQEGLITGIIQKLTDDASTLEERLNSLEQMKVDNMKRDKYEKECAAALVASEKAELEKVSGKVFDLERSLNKIKKIQKSFKKRKRKSEVESDTKSDKKRRVEIRDPTPERPSYIRVDYSQPILVQPPVVPQLILPTTGSDNSNDANDDVHNETGLSLLEGVIQDTLIIPSCSPPKAPESSHHSKRKVATPKKVSVKDKIEAIAGNINQRNSDAALDTLETMEPWLQSFISSISDNEQGMHSLMGLQLPDSFNAHSPQTVEGAHCLLSLTQPAITIQNSNKKKPLAHILPKPPSDLVLLPPYNPHINTIKQRQFYQTTHFSPNQQSPRPLSKPFIPATERILFTEPSLLDFSSKRKQAKPNRSNLFNYSSPIQLAPVPVRTPQAAPQHSSTPQSSALQRLSTPQSTIPPSTVPDPATPSQQSIESDQPRAPLNTTPVPVPALKSSTPTTSTTDGTTTSTSAGKPKLSWDAKIRQSLGEADTGPALVPTPKPTKPKRRKLIPDKVKKEQGEKKAKEAEERRVKKEERLKEKEEKRKKKREEKKKKAEKKKKEKEDMENRMETLNCEILSDVDHDESSQSLADHLDNHLDTKILISPVKSTVRKKLNIKEGQTKDKFKTPEFIDQSLDSSKELEDSFRTVHKNGRTSVIDEGDSILSVNSRNISSTSIDDSLKSAIITKTNEIISELEMRNRLRAVPAREKTVDLALLRSVVPVPPTSLEISSPPPVTKVPDTPQSTTSICSLIITPDSGPLIPFRGLRSRTKQKGIKLFTSPEKDSPDPEALKNKRRCNLIPPSELQFAPISPKSRTPNRTTTPITSRPSSRMQPFIDEDANSAFDIEESSRPTPIPAKAGLRFGEHSNFSDCCENSNCCDEVKHPPPQGGPYKFLTEPENVDSPRNYYEDSQSDSIINVSGLFPLSSEGENVFKPSHKTITSFQNYRSTEAPRSFLDPASDNDTASSEDEDGQEERERINNLPPPAVDNEGLSESSEDEREEEVQRVVEVGLTAGSLSESDTEEHHTASPLEDWHDAVGAPSTKPVATVVSETSFAKPSSPIKVTEISSNGTVQEKVVEYENNLVSLQSVREIQSPQPVDDCTSSRTRQKTAEYVDAHTLQKSLRSALKSSKKIVDYNDSSQNSSCYDDNSNPRCSAKAVSDVPVVTDDSCDAWYEGMPNKIQTVHMCAQCGRVCSSKAGLTLHRKKCLTPERLEIMPKCPVCGEIVRKKGNLKYHLGSIACKKNIAKKSKEASPRPAPKLKKIVKPSAAVLAVTPKIRISTRQPRNRSLLQSPENNQTVSPKNNDAVSMESISDQISASNSPDQSDHASKDKELPVEVPLDCSEDVLSLGDSFDISVGPMGDYIEVSEKKHLLLNEHPVDEHPVDEHQVDEHPVDEHLVDEHPVDEHPVDEHPVDEHQVDEHPVDEVNISTCSDGLDLDISVKSSAASELGKAQRADNSSEGPVSPVKASNDENRPRHSSNLPKEKRRSGERLRSKPVVKSNGNEGVVDDAKLLKKKEKAKRRRSRKDKEMRLSKSKAKKELSNVDIDQFLGSLNYTS